MTNADKFLKNDRMHEFANDLTKFLVKQGYAEEIFQDIVLFIGSKVQPTLTEDERVILRNIQLYTGNPVTIRRIGDGHLYISGGCGFIDFGQYNHLFQFIKERRRI